MSRSLNKITENEKIFIKYYGAKTPLWKYYIRNSLDIIGIRQPVEYYHKHKRLQFEYNTLKIWTKFNFNVPTIVKVNKSNLHLSKIKGRTLSEILSTSGELNTNILIKLFQNLNNRHTLSIRHNEPRLCHVDANLRNIMLSKNEIFHIDFEMGRMFEPVEKWAEREISKLLISILQYQNKKQRENTIYTFFKHYHLKYIILFLVNNKLNRPFSKFRGNNSSKNNNINKYSLYNLALDLKKINSMV